MLIRIRNIVSIRFKLFSNYSNLKQARFLSGYSDDKFRQIEYFANINRNDPVLQADYLKMVSEKDPAYVVRRFESGIFASNSDCRNIYLKALSSVPRSMNLSPSNVAINAVSEQKNNKNESIGKRMKLLKHSFEFLSYGIILFFIYTYFTTFKNQTSFEVTPAPDDQKLTFNDVKGCEEPKQELEELVDYLKNPEKYVRLGGKNITGVLLVGPPGCGKTLLAKAVAGEANVPFYYCSGSDFEEVYVGVGAQRIRKLFEKARESSPCILFIDELDALGAKRNEHDNTAFRLTMNQFLVELDGFEKNKNIIIIGATNMPNSLDKALIRAGRFDSMIEVPLPRYNDRVDIFSYYLKNVKTSPLISAEYLGKLTPGVSGADIFNIVNQAALQASRKGKMNVEKEDFDWAREKVLFGRERRSLIMNENEKRTTAYHEAGHTIVAYFNKNASKPEQVTIIPRTKSLGHTEMVIDSEKISHTYKQLLAEIEVCVGGRAAEEIFLGKENMTTGVSSDLEKATNIALAMIKNCGMSEKFGMTYLDSDNPYRVKVSEEKIYDAVKEILDECYERAKSYLLKNKPGVENLVTQLMKLETLKGDQIKDAIEGVNL